LTFILAVCLALDLVAPAAALAQIEMAGCKVYLAQGPGAGVLEGDRYTLTGTLERPVQIDCDELQFFADRVVGDTKEGRVEADGHVVFVSAGNHISAERMVFNTKTRTGTFYTASGTVRLGDQADRSLFGTQEPDAMFYGETVEKLGPKKYKITRGGFTTCVQPTPRWEMVSGSVTLRIDDYALLTNTVFRVKGVPIMYLPVFYYPMEEDDRSTGFLIPTYGAADVRGQTISNAFFWAIGRSHDATFLHDWFSKTGYGTGAEYRYVLGPGSAGNSRFYMLDEHETTYLNSDGTSSTSPARRSYQVTGGLTQRLPAGLYARANADYFSSITTQQRYQQNLYHATNRTRRFGGQVSGNWNAWALGATLERNDIFNSDDRFATSGSLPRVSIGRGERAIAGLPLYFGVNGEYVTILRSTTEQDIKTRDQGLTRLDVMPTLRVPFTRWPFLSINSSVAWRGTYWTESLENGVQVPESVGRSYFDFSARFTGPVFNRIFNTPGNGYAEKFKHVIEPTFVVQRVTAIDNRNAIVQLEGADYVVGNVTRLTYGLSNRLYAKKETSREIVTATVSQTYYTDQNAVDYDRNYQSSFSGSAPTHFTPVALLVRAAPTDRIQADFRTEWDPTKHAIRTLASNASFNVGPAIQATAGWSQRRFIPGLPGFEESRSDHYFNGMVAYRRPGNRIGGTYAFNYDLKADAFLNQRIIAYYNAQCCGVAMEYQTFNFQTFSNVGVPKDRRFNLSFSLAGIGTFSNFFGALGGQQ
jgi:LPS-assembly protein